jgi:hypothetical protein
MNLRKDSRRHPRVRRMRWWLAAAVSSLSLIVTVGWATSGEFEFPSFPSPNDMHGHEPQTEGATEIVASGLWHDSTWLLRARNTDRGLCLDLAIAGAKSSGGGCGFSVPERRPIAWAARRIPALNSSFFFGPVSETVAAVSIRLSDGQVIETREIVTNPAFAQVGFYWMGAEGLVLPNSIRALDAAGGIISARKIDLSSRVPSGS